MKNVIFLFVTPVVEGDEYRFSLLRLCELGYRITIYDLTPALFPELESRITKRRIHVDYLTYEKVHNIRDFEKIVADRCKNSFFMPMFNDYYQVRKLYSIFTKYNIKFGYVNNLVCEIDIGARIGNILKISSIKKGKISSVLYNRLFRKVLPNKKADFIAFGSKKSEESIAEKCLVGKKTKRVYIHTYDCQRFLDTIPYDNGGRKYCVFLDQYIPFHPDNILDRGLNIDPEAYYREVCDVLDGIRKNYNLDVIIAAHPRADYEKQHRVFPESYKIEMEKTTELIKNATLVVGHFSTSIGLVSLAKVPLYIFLPPSISCINDFRENGLAFARLLGCRIIRKPADLNNQNLCYDVDKYQSFAETYMTCNYTDCQDNLWKPIRHYINIAERDRKNI